MCVLSGVTLKRVGCTLHFVFVAECSGGGACEGKGNASQHTVSAGLCASNGMSGGVVERVGVGGGGGCF